MKATLRLGKRKKWIKKLEWEGTDLSVRVDQGSNPSAPAPKPTPVNLAPAVSPSGSSPVKDRKKKKPKSRKPLQSRLEIDGADDAEALGADEIELQYGAAPVRNTKKKGKPGAPARALVSERKKPSAMASPAPSGKPVAAAEPKPSKPRYFTTLKGRFDRPGWKLAIDDRLVEVKDRKFVSEVELKGETTELKLVATGPKGEVETQAIEIRFPTWATLHDPYPGMRRHFGNIGANFSFINYTDTRVADTTSMSMTLKGAYSYALVPKKWDLGLSGYATLFPLVSSGPSTIRFLGVNGRVGYVAPWLKDPWKLSLMAGFYYTTSFVTSGKYGFGDMMGPQFFPVLTRVLANDTSANFYLKFSPVSGNGFALNPSSSEFAAGGSYNFPVNINNQRKTLSATLDMARLQLLIQGVQIVSTSISIGGAYSF